MLVKSSLSEIMQGKTTKYVKHDKCLKRLVLKTQSVCVKLMCVKQYENNFKRKKNIQEKLTLRVSHAAACASGDYTKEQYIIKMKEFWTNREHFLCYVQKKIPIGNFHPQDQ